MRSDPTKVRRRSCRDSVVRERRPRLGRAYGPRRETIPRRRKGNERAASFLIILACVISLHAESVTRETRRLTRDVIRQTKESVLPFSVFLFGSLLILSHSRYSVLSAGEGHRRGRWVRLWRHWPDERDEHGRLCGRWEALEIADAVLDGQGSDGKHAIIGEAVARG